MTHRCRYCWPNSPDNFPGHDSDNDHWYKTSPHDDRWGSFNPLNMRWFQKGCASGCAWIIILLVVSLFVVILGGVLEWVINIFR